MMVATSSLAVAIGLLAMIAGRPVDGDVAPVPQASESGAEPQMVTREVREPPAFTPPPDIKSDRLPEEAASPDGFCEPRTRPGAGSGSR